VNLTVCALVVAFWLNVIAWVVVCVVARMLPEVPAFDLIDEDTVFSYTPVVLVVGAFASVLAAIGNALAFRFPRVYGFVAIVFEMVFIAGYTIWFCVSQYADTYFIIVMVIVELVLLWTLYNFYKYIDFAEQVECVMCACAHNFCVRSWLCVCARWRQHTKATTLHSSAVCWFSLRG
jgi:hypothetical protein